MGNNLEHDWETMTENQFEVPVDVTNLPTFLQFVNRNAVHQIKIVELRCKKCGICCQSYCKLEVVHRTKHYGFKDKWVQHWDGKYSSKNGVVSIHTVNGEFLPIFKEICVK